MFSPVPSTQAERIVKREMIPWENLKGIIEGYRLNSSQISLQISMDEWESHLNEYAVQRFQPSQNILRSEVQFSTSEQGGQNRDAEGDLD